MAFNKSKHIDAAHKCLQQGKMSQAIAEYQQILKNEPKDQVTLMTLGDLYVRQGQTFEALEYFERLAKLFLNDGFTTKAIAIYKKVAKLAPEETRPLERLAELYVQQGVLSEARPLYLQLAEVHLKAGRQSQSAGLLRKLLEAEPDNLRVQTRLGELQLAMGEQADAVDTFLTAGQRVLNQGDHAEAIRLVDRILQLDPKHMGALTLKAHALAGAGKRAEVTTLLESLVEQDSSDELITMLLEQYLEGGQLDKAAAFVEKLFAGDPTTYLRAHHVATVLIEAGDFARAHTLLATIRNTMIDSGDYEALAQTFSQLIERQPGHIEPLEWLVDLYGRASDSFRLPDALAQLAQALEARGENSRALETYEKLMERTPEDETTRRAYMRLRAKAGIETPPTEVHPPVKVAIAEEEKKPVPPPSTEPALDEETHRYVTQALTDVDLFSSYGLTQKSIDLLETVLERAPEHVPVLERLFDMSVGAGNSDRTVELAAVLERIAIDRKDRPNAEKYSEFRRRFERTASNHPALKVTAARFATREVPEFAVPIVEAELDEPILDAPPVEKINVPIPAESVVHEVDLSEEWAALSQQLDNAALIAPEDSVEAEPVVYEEPPSFELELQPVLPAAVSQGQTLSADSILADLALEFESATEFLGIPAETAQQSATIPAQSPQVNTVTSPARPTPANGASIPAPTVGEESKGPLGDLFEEFRSDLGESGKDDIEDLETHYNLGVAYREMGLLEEAIGEFQKVAKWAEKGPAFRYAMQCCTLLGLAFMDKGQPAIAAIWYERALLTPGLDQESVLALRYDLGVAQELAGDKAAAAKTFSQVYAMNIDYRDISERIAHLGKTR
jgi:tetratricopeptide (TPR) repeat protein